MSTDDTRRQDVDMPDGTRATAWRRSARQIRAGDYLPDYSAAAVAPSVWDESARRHLVALDDGRDIELTRRARVWIVRDYRGASWLSVAAAAYRAEQVSREMLRESGQLAPSSVPGMAGAPVTMAQLEPAEFDTHVPAPVWRDYVREYAPRQSA